MSNYESNREPQPPSRLAMPILIVVVVFLFGLGMAAAGFLAGRASAPMQTPLAALPTQANTAGPIPSVANDLPTVMAPGFGEAADSPAATPTSDSTIPATPTAEPTDEPTAAPTAEPIPPTQEVAPPAGSPLAGVDYATFYDVWDIVSDQYDGEMPPAEEILESVIAGSLATLDDDYTRYVPSDVAKRMREDADGAVEGIGAFVIENDEGLFEIVRPIDGQPADLAGVRAGDVLIEINGQSVVDLSFDEVILMVRGPEGTTVDLTFLREGEAEPLEFTITRTRFEVPVVEHEILPAEMTGGQTIGYLRLSEFTSNAEERLLAALDELLAAGATGLVLDLRDNPGGFLDQSVAVADAFLPSGVALYERNSRGLDDTFVTQDGDAAESIPLVVLVNAGSASASEIVAGALQDRGRAVLVGETTFGKGSVQQIHSLADGSELRVTIARWYTPNDNTIDGEGIAPDIEVATPEDLGGPEDGQLIRAIQYLLTGE